MAKRVRRTGTYGTFVYFDDMMWIDPATTLIVDLDWTFRYGTPTREKLILAATVMDRYRALVEASARKRARVVAAIKGSRPRRAGRIPEER